MRHRTHAAVRSRARVAIERVRGAPRIVLALGVCDKILDGGNVVSRAAGGVHGSGDGARELVNVTHREACAVYRLRVAELRERGVEARLSRALRAAALVGQQRGPGLRKHELQAG